MLTLAVAQLNLLLPIDTLLLLISSDHRILDFIEPFLFHDVVALSYISYVSTETVLATSVIPCQCRISTLICVQNSLHRNTIDVTNEYHFSAILRCSRIKR